MAVGVVIGVPAAVGIAGFTASGIGAGSLAAYLMSLSASLNGGAVPSGGLVAFLQSLGTGGLFAFAAKTEAGRALLKAGCLYEA
jgi:hypothetical protein